ncbi:MAG TPA: amino acid adenylation domain-containing protein, partial [Ruminiclostridium sp.]|nr:amino acid adenylation domain-containing protein [Ruminiclostridium sp.]
MDKFDVLRSLPADKRDLLLKAVQRKKVDNCVSVLPRREQSEPIPASFSQERMWFLNELVPGNPAYNIFLSVRVKGGLNIDILNHTINGIIKRHETLRTRFVTVDGRLVVKLDAELKTQCRVVDLTQLSSYEKEKSIYQLTDEEVKKSFDLASTPLFRITLLKLEEKCYIMLINMHHIISDGWSTGLFLKEITVLYQAGIKGLEAGLPQLEYTYGDYAFWQREYLKGSVLDKKLSFWKKYLGYSSLMLDLPLDKPKQSLQSNMGASSRFAVPDNISSRIKEICRKENITLFTFLLTAFNVLLYKYTYQEDIIVGTPVANRTRSEFEGLIGCFVNTIPLRTDISGNPTFREVLERVSKSNAEAFDNQDMPFDVLVEELHLERDLSRHPIFQVMFVLQNASYKTIGIENVEFEIMNTDSRTSKFDLTLEVYEEEVINGRFEYSTDIFESSTIVRMTENFINLLKNIVNDYGQRVMEIDILGEQERTLILKEWNNTRVEYPKVPSIISLFENQVIKTPDSIAIIFDNKNLTYRDFNSKANQLAHFLIKLGVGRETIVGICMERSFEMVIAIYAILKAGGAYLPIDPDYPGDRIKFIIEDAKVPIVLVQKHLENLFDNSDATVICADTQWSEISIERTDNPVCQNKQEDLAYVIYTSGSTGNPKGVMNTHGGLYNRLMWHQKKFMADDSDTILQKTPYSFDVSVWEFFWPLMCGARLLIAAPGGHKDCRYLADIIRANKVTAVHFVPSMLRAFLGEEGIGECSSLKRVICSGEALTGDIQKLFFEVFGNTLLYNLYGPTEAAIDVSCWECRNDGSSNVPIGKPIDNIQLYILDQKLKPVAAGVPGELYIGGAGLARGYLNKPELTRERFILNPFRSMPGEYLYKTGDLARFKADGNIEYLGRNDFQVKIRGLRVELGEIEALLLQHPCIQEAVVTAREDVPGSKRLVAYIVPDKTNAPEDKEIKGYLMKKLPEYMVPSLIIRLDKLPLLNNGKINRKGLPAPDYSQLRGNRKYVAPRTPVEEKLAGIWSKVLKINQVSICDKFFELGGDSILSIQIVSLANQAGIKITPKQIFEHQSIEELSCVAVLEKTACTEQGMVTGSVPLTPIQKWFFEQELTEPHYFNQAVLLKSKRPISRDTLNSAVQTLIIKHDALRMRFNRTKDGWEQFNSAFDGTIPLEWIEVESSTGIEEFIKNRASALQGSLDITKGPVVRLAYFEIKDAGSGYLLIISHHLVIDGVSWRILINDLELICTGSPDLPPKTTSFKQYSEYLNDYTINEEELLPYLNTFQNEEQGTEFPGASKDKGKNTVESLKCISTALSGEETEELVTETTKTF